MRSKFGIAMGMVLGAFLIMGQSVLAADLVGHRIVLDAGHGGTDPGSTECAGLYESMANLDIAYRLKTRLEESGAKVYMTRIDDSTLDNADRYDYANTTDGEVLVSIHLNGSLDHTYNGTMNLYTKPWKDKEFTATMHSGMAIYLGVPDLGITNFMSGVTLKFNGPAVTVEPLFISNSIECAALEAGTRQEDIVNVLYDGLARWFGEEWALSKFVRR